MDIATRITRAERAFLKSVLAVAALGMAALTLTREVGPFYVGLMWCAWVWAVYRAIQRRSRTANASRVWETPALLGLMAVFLYDFFGQRETLFVAIAHFLLLFQVIKCLGPQERRDVQQIFLFGFLQILSACTLSVDLWQSLVLFGFIPAATLSLFWQEVARREHQWARPLPETVWPRYRRIARLMAATVLPVNVLLTAATFVVFPRLNFNATLPGLGYSRSGYADEVNLSRTGSLALSRVPVLWVRPRTAQERQRWSGYLRGAVLEQFDGRRWLPGASSGARTVIPDRNGVFRLGSPSVNGSLLHQEMTLLDTSDSTLFMSGQPVTIVAPFKSLAADANGVVRWTVAWRKPLRYEVMTVDAPILSGGPPPSAADLELPPLDSQRTLALAQRMAGNGSAEEKARKIEAALRTEYRYSLTIENNVTDDPVADFLFERRSGSCGHFASAMAVMLRLQGIPSRIVAGYLKGEWNEPAGQFLVRQSDAHAWVEAYVSSRGWMRFDPTPRAAAAVASQRRWLHTLREWWDYAGLTWNGVVIEYDLYAQVRTLEALRSTSDPWREKWKQWRQNAVQSPNHATWRILRPGRKAAAALVCGFLIAGLIFWRRGEDAENADVRLYKRFLNRMAKAGYPKRPHETGWEFAQRLALSIPDKEAAIWQATADYYQRRFAVLPPSQRTK